MCSPRLPRSFHARAARGPLRGLWVGWVALAAGCLVDLDPPQPPQFAGNSGVPVAGSEEGGAGGSTGGAAPGGAGLASTGGSGGAAGADPCGTTAKLCGESCVEISPAVGCGADTCDACPALANAQLGCSELGECQVTGCSEGFADCDGDALPGADLSVSNGCEYAFGAPQDSAPPLGVPFGIISVDGSREDWVDYPAYRMQATCVDAEIDGTFRSCNDDEYTPISALFDVPLRQDLDAYFRVAWSGSFFNLLVETYDDQPFDEGLGHDGCTRFQGAGTASCEDSATVFFDGSNDRATSPDYGDDDERVFFGLGGEIDRKNGPPSSDEVFIQVTRNNGPHCALIEARMSWQFLVGAEGSAAPGQFPPAPGNQYGFDVSYSDWDREPGSDTFTRQSQVFWVDPGPDYRFRTTGFGAIELLPSDESHAAGGQ